MYDYETKYENSNAQLVIPAKISKDTEDRIKDYAKRVFKLLNLSQIARIDFFVRENEIYFNEVNTMPGFTNISMYPLLLIHDKIPYKEILNILIEGAKYLK